MISIRVKFQPSTRLGKESVIYYQLIQTRKSRQIATLYKLYSGEWDSVNGILDINSSPYHSRNYLQQIEKQIIRNMTNLQRMAAESNDIKAVACSYVNLTNENSLFRFAAKVIKELKMYCYMI